jgi:hypothetical protein
MLQVEKIQFGLKDVIYIVTLAVTLAIGWSSMSSTNALAIEEIKKDYIPRTEYQNLIVIMSNIDQRLSRIEGQLEEQNRQ